jgi:hypothetical protein
VEEEFCIIGEKDVEKSSAVVVDIVFGPEKINKI